MRSSSSSAWPAGHRAAVALIVVLDEAAIASGYALVGLARLLDIFADLDVLSTILAPDGSLPPTIVEMAREDDHLVLPLNDGELAGETAGLAWQLSEIGADNPVWDEATSRALIPSSPWLTDRRWLAPDRPLPPSSLQEAWSLTIQEGREFGCLAAFVLHPEVIGRPGHIGALRRLLDEIIAYGDIWLARIDHLALFAKALHEDRDTRA